MKSNVVVTKIVHKGVHKIRCHLIIRESVGPYVVSSNHEATPHFVHNFFCTPWPCKHLSNFIFFNLD